jgi:hypothetical protein
MIKPVSPAAPSGGGVWPTPAQELLLRAALLDAPAAPEAWRRWQEVERVDALDQASWKLLPAAYLNLTRLGVRDPLLAETKILYRYHWARNQTLFHRAGGFLDELKLLDIPALVLKGVAFSHLYYRDAGARPMEDLDLLVPIDKFSVLAKYLVQNGWHETENYSHLYFNHDALPSFEFRRDDGFSVDLHGHVLHADCRKGADAPFWAGAQSWDFKGHPALTLCPEDHLLHAVSHGVRWSIVPPCRWMADAWRIVQSTGAGFNWDRVIEQARFHHNVLWMFHGLERMQKIVPLNLPPGFLEQLGATPSTLKRRVDFACDFVPEPLTLMDRVRCLWSEVKKDETNSSWSEKLSNLRSYLMEEWAVSSVFLFPFAALIMLARYLWDKFKLFATPRPRWKFVLTAVRAVILFWRRDVGLLSRRRAS